jgi:hypothetical protein
MFSQENPFENPSADTSISAGLRNLTLLTIIGSILTILSAGWSFATAKKSYESLRDTIESGGYDNAPSWIKSMLSPELLETTKKMYENKFPILLVGVLGGVLCLMGALDMRKRLQQGYWIWVAGEFLPVILMFVLIGPSAFAGWSSIGIVFPVLFLVLYTIRKKELIQ